jgi:hypothetical protein
MTAEHVKWKAEHKAKDCPGPDPLLCLMDSDEGRCAHPMENRRSPHLTG